jgi:ABC-2 type transport system permease protein
MNGLVAALEVESIKAARSRVPWGVAAGFSIAPIVAALFMVILKDPDAARRFGILGSKAEITAGSADWPTMLSMLSQSVAIGGAVLFAFLTAWLFGREFSDRTIRTLLAIPTPRWAIVTAKVVVIWAWGAATIAWIVALGFGAGALLGLPGWSAELAADALARVVGAALLTLVLQTSVAFFAGVGRGYIAPMAWAFATIAVAQVLAVLGLGAAFPWAVPALVSAGAELGQVPATSIALVLVTGAAGLAATIAWWIRADHTG